MGAGSSDAERGPAPDAGWRAGGPRQTAAPARLGRFRLLERIGEGGMGVVYRAFDEVLGQSVALKTVLVADDALVASMRREIHALGRVRHPGVVRVIEEGVEHNRPYYAMELIEGMTLRAWLDDVWARGTSARRRGDATTLVATHDSRLPDVAGGAPPPHARRRRAGAGRLAEVLVPLVRLCDALAFLHGEGVVHRDLKPDNVIVRPDGTPVLVDFGLVGHFSASAGREVLEVDNMLAGSAAYMAPEQVGGELVDARTDLYSLGCILYEAITGQRPFQGANARALQQQHLSALPTAPSALVDDVPPELEALALALLAKRPRERVGHAADVAAVLAAACGGGARAAPPEHLAPRAYLYRPELCGRDEALGALQRRLADAKLGRGSVTFLCGESGVGKTRVALEVARLATLTGVDVIGGECTDLGDGPLSAFRPLLQSLMDRHAGQFDAAARRAFAARGRVLARYEPALLAMPEIAALPEPPWLVAEAERARAFACLRDSLLASDRPLLIVLDDIQWADELSLAFLSSVDRDFLDAARLAVVATVRSEEMSPALDALTHAVPARRIDLDRLDRASVGAMVGDMLGVARAPEPFVEFLADASSGNPFFVAEYLRAAVDGNLLHRSRAGQWVVGEAELPLARALDLPDTLRELIERRLAQLGDRAGQLATAGSVIGRELHWDVLARVLDLDEAIAVDAAGELVRCQVLEESGRGQLRFVHDKLREVAYARIPAAARRSLHARVAAALEEIHGRRGSLSPGYGALAHHFGQAGLERKCLHYLDLAGAHALDSGAHAAAVDFLSRAIERARSASAERVDARRLAHWQRRLGDAHYGSGALAHASEHCLRALDLLGKPAPRTKAAWARVLAANLARQVARSALPRRVARVGAAERAALEDAALAAARIGQRHYFTFEALPMIAASLMSVNLAERVGTMREIARPYALLGVVLGVGGMHRLARVYLDRARESARASDDAYGFVVTAYAEIAYQSGRTAWKLAEEVGREALEVGERLGDPNEIDMLKSVIANVAYFTGDYPRSLAIFEEVRISGRKRGNAQIEAWGLYGGAAAEIALGRDDDAVPALERATKLLPASTDVASQIISHGALGVARLHRGELGLARREADAANALIRKDLPTVYSTHHGYAGSAEVYLSLWAAARRGGEHAAAELERETRRVLFQLRLFARLLPFGRPAAALAIGRFHEIAGHARRAKRCFERAAVLAEACSMPLEGGRARAGLARLARAGTLERRRHADAARVVFEGIGAARDLSLLLDLPLRAGSTGRS